MTGSLGYRSATQLRAAFAAGAMAPADVVAELLDRAGGMDTASSGVTGLDPGGAHAAAVDSARRYRSGSARALEGIPVVVKDLIDAAGMPATYGSQLFRDHRPARDAEVVRRIRAAGGIVLGKTATHEFGWGVTTDGTAAGPIRNPWDPSRVPGGSSGGSAVALALGLAPLALGTDTAGSIRIPAALCGVAGLRPSARAVPRTGVFPLAPSLDQVGPMARTVEDLSLLHGVIAQPAPTRAGRAPLTFGILASHLPVELAPAVTAALEEMAAALSGAGHRVTALSGTGLADAYDTLGDVVLTEGIAVHRTAGLWPHRADDYLPGVRSRLQRADNTDGVAAACARRRRARIAVAAERILRHVDVVVSPASAVAAAAIGHDRDPSAPEAEAFRAGVIACCAWQSLTGLPTCVVRVRFDPNGLPIGLQFTARRGADGVALEAAALTVRLTADIQDQWPSPGVREQLP